MFRKILFPANKIFRLIIAVFLLAAWGLPVKAGAKLMEFAGKQYDIAEPGEFIPGEVVVRMQPGVSPAAVQALARQMGARIKGQVPEYSLFLLALPPTKTAGAEALQTALQALQAHPQVEQAFPNYKFSLPRPAGPKVLPSSPTSPAAMSQGPAPEFPAGPGAQGLLEAYQWHLHRLKYFQAGSPPAQGPIIAVLDTGVDYNHPDLAGKVIKGWDFVEEDDDPMDANGHGTHVAGIAAAGSGPAGGVVGISPTSKILAVRVLDAAGGGTYFNAIQGLLYARNYPQVKILNLSLSAWLTEGSAAFNTLKQAVDDTLQKGVLVCVAAGNDSNYWFYYREDYHKYRPVPAWYPNSFAVGATQEVDSKAYFSNYNVGTLNGTTYNYQFVDLVAPGWNILSTWPMGRCEWQSGTSMASPMVAGAAARVWAQNPTWTRAQVVSCLKSTGRPLGIQGYGFYVPIKRLDLMRALGEKQTGFVGLVYNGQTGHPLTEVKVEALSMGGVQATAFTNTAGFFTMTGLTGGVTYNLRFKKTGFSNFVYSGLKTTADNLNDLYMPVFLHQVRPADQWSLMITWHSWHPGYEEAKNSPDQGWWPIKYNETQGFNIMPQLSRGNAVKEDWISPWLRGSLLEPPYGALTHDAFDDTVPLHCIIKKKDSRSWWFAGFYGHLVYPVNYPCWGNTTGPGVNTKAYIYYGGTLRAVVPAIKATGSGYYWVIGKITEDELIIINKFSDQLYIE